eukprot:355607-Chlamydomonas_euryale.AAC.9
MRAEAAVARARRERPGQTPANGNGAHRGAACSGGGGSGDGCSSSMVEERTAGEPAKRGVAAAECGWTEKPVAGFMRPSCCPPGGHPQLPSPLAPQPMPPQARLPINGPPSSPPAAAAGSSGNGSLGGGGSGLGSDRGSGSGLCGGGDVPWTDAHTAELLERLPHGCPCALRGPIGDAALDAVSSDACRAAALAELHVTPSPCAFDGGGGGSRGGGGVCGCARCEAAARRAASSTRWLNAGADAAAGPGGRSSGAGSGLDGRGGLGVGDVLCGDAWWRHRMAAPPPSPRALLTLVRAGRGAMRRLRIDSEFQLPAGFLRALAAACPALEELAFGPHTRVPSYDVEHRWVGAKGGGVRYRREGGKLGGRETGREEGGKRGNW